MKRAFLIILFSFLNIIIAKAQTPGCLYGNVLYTTVNVRYDGSPSGAKVVLGANECFSTSDPAPTTCEICLGGVNGPGNCRVGGSVLGSKAIYVIVACPLDGYMPLFIFGVGIFGLVSARKTIKLPLT
ncbi:MAG: hypothetical protein EOO91_10350 [Pedobacter sp.]|nr:MAG: hypothetical protein EOO91_10350 [Pedobacter sp.]